MDGEHKISLPIPQILTPEIPHESGKKKLERKHMIWASAGVSIVLILVIGFSLGGYFFFRTTTHMADHYQMQWKNLKKGETVNQELDNNVEENTKLYHLHTPTSEQWQFLDFNKGIEVYKFVENGKTSCFVSPLNRSREITPADTKIEMSKDMVDDSDTQSQEVEQSDYTASEYVIEDPTFLGPRVKELCDGHDMKWISPSCAEEKINVGNDDVDNARAVGRHLLLDCPDYQCQYISSKSCVIVERVIEYDADNMPIKIINTIVCTTIFTLDCGCCLHCIWL